VIVALEDLKKLTPVVELDRLLPEIVILLERETLRSEPGYGSLNMLLYKPKVGAIVLSEIFTR